MQVTVKWDVTECFFLWFILQCSQYLTLHAADPGIYELGRIWKHLWPIQDTYLLHGAESFLRS